MKPPTIRELAAYARKLPGEHISMAELYRFIDHANQYRPEIWESPDYWGTPLLRWWSLRQCKPRIPNDIGRPVRPRFYGRTRPKPREPRTKPAPRPIPPPQRLASAVALALDATP
jgi:hypothetical protein